jgi:hypothetical protein
MRMSLQSKERDRMEVTHLVIWSQGLLYHRNGKKEANPKKDRSKRKLGTEAIKEELWRCH